MCVRVPRLSGRQGPALRHSRDKRAREWGSCARFAAASARAPSSNVAQVDSRFKPHSVRRVDASLPRRSTAE
eukprot:5863612-Prymnesium_polylepis.1